MERYQKLHELAEEIRGKSESRNNLNELRKLAELAHSKSFPVYNDTKGRLQAERAMDRFQSAAYPLAIIRLLDIVDEFSELVEHQKGEIERLQKIESAVRLYLKYINSPVCIGWDNLIGALQPEVKDNE